MKRFVLSCGAAVCLLSGAAFAQTQVKLGVLTDLSGAYAEFSGPGTVAAVTMAVRDHAQQLGLSAEVVSGDTQGKPDIGTEVARRWYDSEGVDVILDVPGSAIAFAVQGLAAEKKKLFIAGSGSSDEISGKRCNPYTVQYAFNVSSLTTGIADPLVKSGLDSWYFITVDNAFGVALENSVSAAVVNNGGQVLGSSRLPFNNLDFSAAIYSAQASGAKVIALANAGQDLQATLRQAAEFGLAEGGQTLVALTMFITDVHALGGDVASGLNLTSAFYWNRDEASRNFAAAFEKETGRKPTSVHAAMYSATAHYLKSVAAAGDKERLKVAAQMKAAPVEDFFSNGGMIQPNGLHIHDMYQVKVKSAAEMQDPWDHFEVVGTIPAAQAFAVSTGGDCILSGL